MNTTALKAGAAPFAVALALVSAPAFAQATPADAEAANPVIVVTGSSIKQALDKSTLPVTTVTSVDIAKTGLTSTTDLIQQLPSIQGFVPASSSVNGGGGGVTTAAIHSLPSKYTLTLLDGQRIAPLGLGAVQGGGYGVNIDSIPVDAIERVEVLRDGAGAIYGADAVAGVVNFRLKKNITTGNVYVSGELPQEKGGRSWSAGISKGFGDLETDGFNIFASYSHEWQQNLQASQRDVSKNGAYFKFSRAGNNYVFFNPTSNTEPANITLSSGGKGYTFNPYYAANNNCGSSFAFPLTTAAGLNCRFNYAATVQAIPKSHRDSGLIKAVVKTGDVGELWVSAFVSKSNITGQYAPPAQPFGLNATTRFPTLWNKYVVPYLAANGITADKATLNYRAVSAGGRADSYDTTTYHIAAGYDTNFAGFDAHLMLVESHVHASDTAAGGFLDFNKLEAAVASGKYDPVLGTGADSLSDAILKSRFSTTDSDVKTAKFNVVHDLFKLPGGTSQISVGGEFNRTTYRVNYSDLILSNSGFSTQPASANYPVGGNYGQVPFGAERNNWGLFAEAVLPATSNLEFNLQGRYDSYSRVNSDFKFNETANATTGLYDQIAGGKLGNTFRSATGKASFRFTPIEQIAFRGSIGTGFRAPALSDIVGPVTFSGSTSGTYACPFPGSPGCLPGSAQYDLLAGANGLSGDAGLKPEKSTNWGLGASFTPIRGLYFNVDFWNVSLKNQIQSSGVAEQVAFNNPGTYAGLFVNPYQDPAGFTTIALKQLPFNGGEAKYSGIDWDFGWTTPIGSSSLNLNWSGTWTLKQKYNDFAGGPYNTDLGIYGPDQRVVFRVVSNVVATVKSGAFTNVLTARFKTGYRDQAYSADNGTVFTDNNGLPGTPVTFNGLKVRPTVFFDWQGSYDFMERYTLTAGIHNIGNKAPPLSLQTGGGGNQVGYDGRYYDPTGRSFYLRASAKF